MTTPVKHTNPGRRAHTRGENGASVSSEPAVMEPRVQVGCVPCSDGDAARTRRGAKGDRVCAWHSRSPLQPPRQSPAKLVRTTAATQPSAIRRFNEGIRCSRGPWIPRRNVNAPLRRLLRRLNTRCRAILHSLVKRNHSAGWNQESIRRTFRLAGRPCWMGNGRGKSILTGGYIRFIDKRFQRAPDCPSG